MDSTKLNEKVARLVPDADRQRSGKDPRLQGETSQLPLAMGYLFDPMHGPLEAHWIHGQTGERHTNAWFNNHYSDLNACAEFEKMLTHEQCSQYHRALEAVQDEMTQERDGETEYPAQDFWFHATAEQRCRAFIAVMETQRDAGNASNQKAQ